MANTQVKNEEVPDTQEGNSMEGNSNTVKQEHHSEPTPPPTDDEQQPAKVTKAKGKKAGKKAAKKPAAKKRKLSETDTKEVDEVDVKNEAEDDENKENEDPEDTKDGKKKGTRGRKKGAPSEAWNDEQDKILIDLVKRHTDNNPDATIPWQKVTTDYQEILPGTKRTFASLRMRWVNYLKYGETDLSESEIMSLRQAVTEINGSEKNAAIAWRYEQLTKKPINKTAVAKLLKNLSIN